MDKTKTLTPRQAEIVDAALKLIAEQGIQHLTIRNLSTAIGVTEAALYRLRRTELVLAKPDLARVVFAEELFKDSPETEQILHGMMQRHYKIMERHFQEAVEDGAIRMDIPMDTLFRLVLGPLRLLIKQWGLSGGSFDLCAKRDEMLSLMKELFAPNI